MPITRAPYFSPTQIGGCALWLDAADSSTMTFSSGSNVTAWNDKINGKSFTGLATFSNYSSDNTSLFFSQATAPLKYLTNTSLSIAPPYTLFSVALLANPINANELVINGLAGTYDTNLFVGNYLNNATVFTGNGSTWNGANSQSYGSMSNVWSITAASIATSNVNAYFNGAPQTQQVGTVTTPTLTGLNIGGGFGTLTNQGNTNYQPFGGYVGEILFYTGTLTTDQRQKVEAYLAQKWGLVGSLAQGHLGTTATLYRSVKVGTTYKPLYTQFNPTSIPGCQLWLDGADPLNTGTPPSSGATVSTWYDKSGKGYNATGGVSPTYSSKAIQFGGSSYLSTSYPAGNTSASYFLVFTPTSTAASTVLGGNALNTAVLYSYLGSFILGDWNTAVATNPTAIATGTTYIASGTSGSGTLSLGINGGLLTTGSSTLSGTGTFTIGAGYTDNRNKFIGSISEILVYNTALTTTQRQTIESYLAQKWGLTASLPTFPGVNGISGCKLWLDGADPAATGVTPTNGSAISTWVDKSGNAYNFTVAVACNATAPLYNSSTKALQFVTASSNSLAGPQAFGDSVANNSATFFFLGQRTTTGYSFFLDGNGLISGNLMLGFLNDNMELASFNVGALDTAITAYAGGSEPLRIYSYESRTTGNSNILNGSVIGSNTSNWVMTSFLIPELGRRYGNSSSCTYHSFNLFEMIVYVPAITTTQRQQVEGYLAAKWGIQASLSNGHPYSTSAPASHINNTQPAGLPAIETLATAQKGTANLSYIAGLSYYNVGATYWDKWQLYLQRFTSANSGAVATYTSNAVTGAGGGFNGGVLAPNGKIYCIGASNIGIIDPTTNALSLTATTTSAFYGGHVLAPNGKIYCIPSDTTGVIGVVDPTTNTFSTPVSGTAVSTAYNGGVLAPNGKIYCMPYRATNVGVIDPVANTFTTFGSISDGTSSGAYNAGVVAPNGKIYCIPRYATAVGVIDPALNTFTSFGTTATYSTGAYIGGVLAPNGKIYCIPLGAPTVAVIDPVLNTFTTNTISGTPPGGYAYYGGVLGPDGKIYCIPLTSTNVGVIDPVANTFTTFGTAPSAAYYGGVLAPNGKIYCIPYNGSLSPGIISFSGLSQLPNSNYCLSAYTNKL